MPLSDKKSTNKSAAGNEKTLYSVAFRASSLESVIIIFQIKLESLKIPLFLGDIFHKSNNESTMMWDVGRKSTL